MSLSVRPGPPDAAPARAEAGATIPSAEPAGAAGLVLIVERDRHVRELETIFLERAGFSVQFAADGAAAFDLARRIEPDIVITEILVPTLDGLALCRKLKALPATRATAVLVFSLLSAASRAREAGADAFLMKPLSERRLVDTVRSLVEARRTGSSPHAPEIA